MRSLAVLGFSVAACVACASDSALVQVNTEPRGGSEGRIMPPFARIEAEVHERVNRHRLDHRLPALDYDPRIAELARAHSEAMARGRPFSHEGFDARAAQIAHWMPVRRVAENIFFDTRPDSATRAVSGWLRSPGHRGNIEGPYTRTGIGVAQVDGGPFYFTQIFVAAPSTP